MAESSIELKHRVLPDGCIDILFFAGDSPRLIVVGTMRCAEVVSLRGKVEIAAVRFRPGGAYPIFGIPASDLTDRTVALEEIWGNDCRELTTRMMEAGDLPPRLSLLQTELCRRIPDLRPVDPYVESTVELILRTGGTASSHQWIRRTGISRQYLARKFDEWVGVAPKFLSRVARLHRVLYQVKNGDSIDWCQLAAESGYFDQAHLIEDFKQLTGVSPGQYFARR